MNLKALLIMKAKKAIRKLSKPVAEPKPIELWLERIESLISKHSTPARTRGKYKGHASTDSVAWVQELTVEVQKDIRLCNKGIGYDENMALASRMGQILAVWYCTVHRAKSFDARRPLNLRRDANFKVVRYRGLMVQMMSDDWLMFRAFPNQPYNYPWGEGAIDGDFV